MNAAQWSETWPLMVAFAFGLGAGAVLVWEHAWVRGKRTGYAWGRQDEHEACVRRLHVTMEAASVTPARARSGVSLAS